MDRVEELKRRCRSDSEQPEYWFKLEEDVKLFLKDATEKEKKEWMDDWGYGERLHMICSGLRNQSNRLNR